MIGRKVHGQSLITYYNDIFIKETPLLRQTIKVRISTLNRKGKDISFMESCNTKT